MQVENLAAYRYEMMEKGYMNKSELSKFLGCGRKKGSKIFQKIMEDIKKRRPRKYRQQYYSNQACCSVSRPHTKEYRRILRAFYKKRLEDLVRKRIRL